jgi:hypothetical protein
MVNYSHRLLTRPDFHCVQSCPEISLTFSSTASSAAFCNSIRFPVESAQDYFCDSTSISSWQLAWTTYAGEASPLRSFSTRIYDPSASTTTTSSLSSKPTTSTTSSSPTTSSSSSASPAATDAATSTTTTTATSQSGGGGVPIGAVVGGSVGGVAAIAAIGALIFFLCRRKPKKEAAPAAAAPTAFVQPGQNPQNLAYMGANDPTKPMVQAQTHEYNGQGWVPQGDSGGYYVPVQNQGQYLQPGQTYQGQQMYNQQAYSPQGSPGTQNAMIRDPSNITSPVSAHNMSSIGSDGVVSPHSPTPTFTNPGGYMQPQMQMQQPVHEMSGVGVPVRPILHDGVHEVPGSDATK